MKFLPKTHKRVNSLLFVRPKFQFAKFPRLMYLNNSWFDKFLDFTGYLRVLQMAVKRKEETK